MHSSGQVRNVFGTLRTVTEHLQGIVKLVLRTEVNLGTGFLSYLTAIVNNDVVCKSCQGHFLPDHSLWCIDTFEKICKCLIGIEHKRSTQLS